eukprot:4428779-Pyramimonas_sp.AAC.2
MQVGKFFRSVDVQNKGYITKEELQLYFVECGDTVSVRETSSLLPIANAPLYTHNIAMVYPL